MPYLLRKKGRHLEDSIRNRFDYWKRVKQQMEMHETKQKSILFRKQILDDRVRANYQNEYEDYGELLHILWYLNKLDKG